MPLGSVRLLTCCVIADAALLMVVGARAVPIFVDHVVGVS